MLFYHVASAMEELTVEESAAATMALAAEELAVVALAVVVVATVAVAGGCDLYFVGCLVAFFLFFLFPSYCGLVVVMTVADGRGGYNWCR